LVALHQVYHVERLLFHGKLFSKARTTQHLAQSVFVHLKNPQERSTPSGSFQVKPKNLSC